MSEQGRRGVGASNLEYNLVVKVVILATLSLRLKLSNPQDAVWYAALHSKVGETRKGYYNMRGYKVLFYTSAREASPT